MVKKNNNTEPNYVSRWRPTVAYAFVAIIIFDYIIAPLVMVWHSIYTGTPLVPWVSLTSSNGGVFFFAIAAIVGASAWTRGQEKIERIRRDDAFYEDSYTVSEERNSITPRPPTPPPPESYES